MIILAIMLFILGAGSLILGIRQLQNKGPLINNAWLYADERERQAMDKAEKAYYYRQSGTLFLIIGLQFLMIGIFCLTKNSIFLYLQYTLIGCVLVFAIVSEIWIRKAIRKMKEN